MGISVTTSGGRTITRRSVLAGALAAAAAGRLSDRSAFAVTPRGPVPAALDVDGLPVGLSRAMHAMHVHGSGSEGGGSWSNHVDLAQALGIAYVHPSDHDWRIDARHERFRQQYDFSDGLAGWLTWSATSTGAAGGGVGIVDLTGADSAYGSKALRLWVGTPEAGTRGVKVTGALNDLAGNVRGRRIHADLRIVDGVLKIRVVLSRHDSVSSTTWLAITYVVGDVPPGDQRIKDSEWEVNVAVPAGRWTTIDVRPADDIARLWPAIDAEDNSFTGLSLTAASTGRGADVIVPKLGLARDIVGDRALAMHSEMLDRQRRRATHKGVVLGNALEYSWDGALTHANGFFADRAAPLLPGTHPHALDPTYVTRVAAAVHDLGGIVSLNHPAGSSDSLAANPATLARTVARAIVGGRCYGVDLIEIGYQQRGLDLERFLLSLGGMVWRDGWFFTANGVTDDHTGTAQLTGNSGVTHAWAADASLATQLAALKAGRAHVSMLGSYQGSLWLSLNSAPMGSVQVNPATTGTNQLTLAATGLPAGSSVEFYQGPVDYPGAGVTSSGLTRIATISPSDLTAGAVTLTPGRASSSYHLAVVRNAGGGIVGFTNPVWDLKAQNPARPIPADRLVA